MHVGGLSGGFNMALDAKTVVRCDVPGCKSYCELGTGNPVPLSKRGWHEREVADGEGWSKTQHLCPGHNGDWSRVKDSGGDA